LDLFGFFEFGVVFGVEVQESSPLILRSAGMFVLVAHQLRGWRRCLIEKGFLLNQKKSPKQKGKKKKMPGKKKITSECS